MGFKLGTPTKSERKYNALDRSAMKFGLFETQTSNGPYVVGFQMVPTIRKLEKIADLV